MRGSNWVSHECVYCYLFKRGKQMQLFAIWSLYLCSVAMNKGAPTEAPLTRSKAVRPRLRFSHTSNNQRSWVVMNAAVDMYPAPETRLRDTV